MTARTVQRTWKSRPTLEGAGVRLRRAFGFDDAGLFDPFLMLDDFRSNDPAAYQAGFPWHPHRGIETITYMLDGECEHGDSMGNRGVISAGDVQWMTAGSGIIHQEMPAGDASGCMGGFQLWANLPAADKMMDPRYCGVSATEIPVVESDDARVRVVAGEVEGVAGPVRDVVIDPEYLDVAVRADRIWRHDVTPGHTVFAYVFEGEVSLGPEDNATPVAAPAVALFGDGDEVVARVGAEGARFLLVSGRPLREPIAWRGPIVMNTDAELREAFREYHDGTFVKHG